MSVLLPGFASEASACTCGPVEPCEAYASASTVFVGRALKVGMESSKGLLPPNAASTTLTSGGPVAHFLVEEALRGIDEKEVEISGESTTCDYYFKEGKRYLVYAYRNPDDKRLHTNICSGTSLLTEAKAHLVYLRAEAKSPSGGTFSGHVYRLFYDSQKDDWDIEMLPKVKVILETGAQQFHAFTNKKGLFEISGLPAGHYKVRTDPATNYSTIEILAVEPRKEWEVDLPDHGCVWQSFKAMQEAEISGQVIDENGQGVKGRWVDIISADPHVKNLEPPSAKTDEDGRFKFSFLPAGRYFIGFNIISGPHLDDPISEFYYAGVTERTAATPIFVGENQSVSGLKLSLPLRVPERVIEGVAVWKDGRPAVDVDIELKNSRSGYQAGSSARTDEQGRFALKGLEGQTYGISAYVSNGTRLVYSKPLIIKLGKENKAVKLVIELP